MSQQRRGGRSNLGVLLLGTQLMSVGFDAIPPVTLITILGQAAVFLGFFPTIAPYNTYKYCLRAGNVWWYREWYRLFFSQIMHADDFHLYYNMMSFLWKGRRLERRFGTTYFAYLLGVLTVLTSCTMVGLAVLIEKQFDIHGFGLMDQCAVGFSGVIFALKVLCNHYFPFGDQRVLGILPLPSKYVCWAELVIIQLLVPNASFLGHLAGILVGMAYLYSPVGFIVDMFMQPESHSSRYRNQRRSDGGSNTTHNSRGGWFFGRKRPQTWGSGLSGRRSENPGPPPPPYPTTSDYGFRDSSSPNSPPYPDDSSVPPYPEAGHQQHQPWSHLAAGLSEEEQMRRAMQASRHEQEEWQTTNRQRRRQPTAPPLYPDLSSYS